MEERLPLSRAEMQLGVLIFISVLLLQGGFQKLQNSAEYDREIAVSEILKAFQKEYIIVQRLS